MKGLSIGQVAHEASVNIETIRYYERLGLISEPPRTEAGYRIFSPEVVDRIRFIKRSQDLGFTLSEINQLLTLTDSENYSCRDVQQFASQKLQEIELKIRDLLNIRDVLLDLLSQCSKRPMQSCPIIERLSE